MRKIKLIFILIYVFLFLININSYGYDDEKRVNIETIDGVQYLLFNTYGKPSNAGVKFRTLGWNVEFEVEEGNDKKIYSMVYPMNDGGEIGNIKRTLAFRGKDDSILGVLLKKYTNEQDRINISDYIFTGGKVNINAIQTIVRNGKFEYKYDDLQVRDGVIIGNVDGLYFDAETISNEMGSDIDIFADYYNLKVIFESNPMFAIVRVKHIEGFKNENEYEVFNNQELRYDNITKENSTIDLNIEDYSNKDRRFIKVDIKMPTLEVVETYNKLLIKDYELYKYKKFYYVMDVIVYYEKEVVNPVARLEVSVDNSSYTSKSGKVYQIEDNYADVKLKDNSIYKQQDIEKVTIFNEANEVVKNTNIKYKTFDLGKLPIGSYRYYMRITLKDKRIINDDITFSIVNPSDIDVEAKVLIDKEVLEIYKQTDGRFNFEATSDYELKSWKIVEGKEYINDEIDGELYGYIDDISLDIEVPVKKNIIIGVEVEDENGGVAVDYVEFKVNTKNLKPVAYLDIRTENINQEYVHQYKEYKKIRIDQSASDKYTDKEVLKYAPNNYMSGKTKVEIQAISSQNDRIVDIDRNKYIYVKNNNILIKEDDRVVVYGDDNKDKYIFIRIDKCGWYRFRNRIYNGYETSDWSEWIYIYVDKEVPPCINDIIIQQLNVDYNKEDTFKDASKSIIYRNEQDCKFRFSINADIESIDNDIIDKFILKINYDYNNNLNMKDNKLYSNMSVSEIENNY